MVSSVEILPIGLLLILAAACKSALVPFSGWLPRAMEGPTPSSAVFYGALSVHLGAYLLLRVGPLLDASPALSATLVVLGLLTAVYAYVAASVQTDIKSALSFASLAQVGIIIAEIGLGWRFIPLVHILGHAFLRTLQFLRAPTLLQDYRHLENALGERLPRGAGIGARVFTPALRIRLYRFALERGYFDSILIEYIGKPFVRVFRWFDRAECRAIDTLAGRNPNAGGVSEQDVPPQLP
jgi:NAD(P)H-quinone oxidoreductase subunit 5